MESFAITIMRASTVNRIHSIHLNVETSIVKTVTIMGIKIFML